MDAVRLERGIERANDSGREGSRRDCGEDGEERRCGRDNGGYTAAPAGEDGKEADKDFERGDADGEAVRDEHPMRSLFVRIQPLFKSAWQDIISAAAQPPDFSDVEKVVCFGLTAVGDVKVVVRLFAGAVVPETDLVKVGEGSVSAEGGDGVEESVV